MSLALWSWLLFAVSAFGLWLTGTHMKAGWTFAIANQVLIWLPYAVITGQWGMIANTVVFIGLYSRNLWRWRHTPTPNAVMRHVPAEAAS